MLVCFIYRKDYKKYVEGYHIVQPELHSGSLSKLRFNLYIKTYKHQEHVFVRYLNLLIKSAKETERYIWLKKLLR